MGDGEVNDMFLKGNIGYVLADGIDEIKVVEKYKFFKSYFYSPNDTKVYKYQP